MADVTYFAGAQEFVPNPLWAERMARMKTAVALGTPDRVPVCLLMDAFAARTMGIKLAEFAKSVDVSGSSTLAVLEKLGDVDSVHFAANMPQLTGMIWLSPVLLPGVELHEDSLWQMDERVRIQPEDYDKILEIGWKPWLGEYIGKYLRKEAAAAQILMAESPRWAAEYMRHGYVVFSAALVNHPFEYLCGGRSVKEFMLDLFHMPDKIQAVMEVIMAEQREQARGMVRALGHRGYWVGGWRTAPEFLSPRLWNRFVWPYMKELVEIVAEEGGTPVLHYDANWDREIERLLELPKARCMLCLDSKTDIFRAKKILAGHMCIMGDVPPSLLSLGTVKEVQSYCHRLLTEVGPDGYIMAMGCVVPPNAKFENVQALVDSVRQ